VSDGLPSLEEVEDAVFESLAPRIHPDDRRIVRLLKFGHFERRPRGGWRFGTKVIADHIVQRLIAAGAAELRDDRVIRSHAIPTLSRGAAGAPSASDVQAGGAPVAVGGK